jgi:hypothetical protein
MMIDFLMFHFLIERKNALNFFKSAESETKLNAHHVQKKIVKLKMDKRPIKHRLSDINRRNVNLNKCITKVVGAPADYTIVSAEGEIRDYIPLQMIINFSFTCHVINLSELQTTRRLERRHFYSGNTALPLHLGWTSPKKI